MNSWPQIEQITGPSAATPGSCATLRGGWHEQVSRVVDRSRLRMTSGCQFLSALVRFRRGSAYWDVASKGRPLGPVADTEHALAADVEADVPGCAGELGRVIAALRSLGAVPAGRVRGQVQQRGQDVPGRQIMVVAVPQVQHDDGRGVPFHAAAG